MASRKIEEIRKKSIEKKHCKDLVMERTHSQIQDQQLKKNWPKFPRTHGKK